MKTITLLKLEPGQKIARPFSRASSKAEAAEILGEYEQRNSGPAATRNARAKHAAHNATPALFPDLAKNLDTDRPVFELGRVKFFAFTER